MSDIKYTETHARSLTKAIIYRIIVTIAIALLVMSAGATAQQTGMVVLAVIFVGFAVYYIHERLWLLTFWKRSNDAVDRSSRSIVKTITYRVAIMLVAFVFFKLILGQDNATTAGLAVAQALINMVFFYIVERVFGRINWGKIPVKE